MYLDNSSAVSRPGIHEHDWLPCLSRDQLASG